jgi:cobalt-zinc-cadmium efflux system membrane fusion protein
MAPILERCYRYGRGPLLGAFILLTAGSATYVASKMPAPSPPTETHSAATGDEPAKIRRCASDCLVVPDEIAQRMRLQTGVATEPTRPRKLAPFQGRLALDNNLLTRVRSAFAGDVVELGRTGERPLRQFDPVTKGQLLAVVRSKDLGEKKSELIDALSKLRTDERTLRQLEALYKEAGTAERSVREAERNVQADRVAVERAERTLRAWKLGDAEIAAVRAEADRLSDPAAPRIDPAAWARVEIRSPRDGLLLEKNFNPGDLVDTSVDMFKVGEITRLMVWAHVFEEDLPLLQGAGEPLSWTVAVPARPGTTFTGALDFVGPVIDPNQQTALATGTVENPRGELKVGQFVTATVELPPSKGEVELPADAVVEDGRNSVVFVRRAAHEFVQRRVIVTKRFHDVIYVKLEPGGVAPGNTVVTSGALLLRDALDQLPASE